LRRLAPYLILALAVGGVLFLARQVAALPLGQGALEDGSREVRGGTTVGQTIVAPFDGLYRVDVYLSPGGRANTADVVLHIRTAPDATEDLASAVVNASTVKRDRWVRFEFAPLPD